MVLNKLKIQLHKLQLNSIILGAFAGANATIWFMVIDYWING